MVVIRKNWQALPASATTVTTPNIEGHASVNSDISVRVIFAKSHLSGI